MVEKVHVYIPIAWVKAKKMIEKYLSFLRREPPRRLKKQGPRRP